MVTINITTSATFLKDKLYECRVDSIIEALDKYIEEKLIYEKGFALSKSAWTEIRQAAIDAEVSDATMIELVNGLCKNSYNKITKVTTQTYPIEKA